MDFAARLDWIDRVYANGKEWNALAETLFTAGKERQGFVAASFAAEEFAKAFLLWYSLATQVTVPPGLTYHAVKQVLGSLLVLASDAPDADYEFHRLTTDPKEYLKEIADEGWEDDRRKAVYEDESGVPDLNVTYVSGVALELEVRLGRLIELTKGTNRFDVPTLAQHFDSIFNTDED